MRKAEKLRRHSAGHDDIAEQIDAMIALLSIQISVLDQRIKAIIAADRALAEQAALMSAVPVIGPTVMAVLLGELPELGTLCRRKIASLAGLAPHARESGTWKGARRIWGGRRKVREALYIASRRVPALIAMRDRMRAKGKAPKTILIAIARQLLVILNAMIQKGQPLQIT
ncbi:transposase [Gluconobacter japonicus]|uniref:transposase n=1 Tax=Gluconobacter japonicus TaxID=376620 RepID=UPI000B13A12C|nr:transposase [Gluconobacter japonicus]